MTNSNEPSNALQLTIHKCPYAYLHTNAPENGNNDVAK